MPQNDFINRQVNRLISDNSPTTLMGARGMLRFNSMPTWLIYLIIVAIAASWVPIAGAVRARFVNSKSPRVHLIQDMDIQPRYEAQSSNPVFANNMSMRPPIPGTVRRGGLARDDFLELGFTMTSAPAGGEAPQVEFFDGFPESVTLDADFLARGKDLYARYCYVCHGFDGYGNGPIHVRSMQRPANNVGWVQPSNLHDDVRRSRPTGHIYNTVNNGIRTMGGYGAQIPAPADRWAVVAYVKALQLSQNAPVEMIPEEIRQNAPVRPPTVGGRALGQATTQPAEDPTTSPGAGRP